MTLSTPLDTTITSRYVGIDKLESSFSPIYKYDGILGLGVPPVTAPVSSNAELPDNFIEALEDSLPNKQFAIKLDL